MTSAISAFSEKASLPVISKGMPSSSSLRAVLAHPVLVAEKDEEIARSSLARTPVPIVEAEVPGEAQAMNPATRSESISVIRLWRDRARQGGLSCGRLKASAP